MTRVTAQAEKGKYYIKADGHAMGSSEVCAAVSGIVYALAGYLENSESIACEEVTLSEGRAEFRFVGADDAEAVYLMTLIGLCQIEEQYPEYIEIKEELP